MRTPSRRTLLGVAIFLIAVLVVYLLPGIVTDFRAQQFAYVGIYLVALLGLNILTGYTGQISLGHGAFMALGGYTTAILVSENDPPLELAGHVFSNELQDLWTIPIAGLVAGLAGVLFGIPALRLTGLYLALATFAIAVATPAVIKKFESLTGGGSGINLFGAEGLTGVPRTDPVTFERVEGVTVLGYHMSFNVWLYYLAWTVALALFAAAWLILRGRIGRAFRAVRDSELAAASSGVNLAAYKTLAFGLSSFYAGVAGALYVIATTFANPETFPIRLSIFLLVGLVVGGLGSLWTLVVGAIFIQFLPLWSQELSKAPGAPSVVYGVILIAVMLAFPQGAAGLARRTVALTSRVYTRTRR